MNELCTFELHEGDVLQLDGELTFRSAPNIYRMADQRFPDGNGFSIVDLSGIGRADSAGLALLLEWQAQRKDSESSTLRFINAPGSLIRLAELCEALELLNLTGRGDPQ